MEKEKNGQLIIKICCVFAAFVLWLYISNIQNPIITYNLKHVPVELKNIDSLSQYKLILAEQEEYFVDLSLRGVSSEVYKIKSQDFKIIADLSAYRVKNGENRIPIEINQSPENINIMNSANLWVKVNLDELIEKTVPVKINIKGVASDGYYVDKPIVKPSEVIVYGAAKYVNAVNRVEGEIYVTNSENDISVSTALMAVDSVIRTIKDVKVQPNFADVLVPIKRMKKVKIEVDTEGVLNEKYIIKSITPVINEVSIVGYDDVIKHINYLKTEPIDLEKIIANKVVEAKLIIPDEAKIIDNSDTINVKIEIEKIIQKNMSIDINIKNLDEKYEAQLDNKVISLVLEGTESAFDKLDYANITCDVDLMSLVEGNQVVPVNVYLPENLTLISQNHEMVKVGIKEKDVDSVSEADKLSQSNKSDKLDEENQLEEKNDD